MGVPAWLSLTCADGRTRAGEEVEAVFAMAADVAEVIAVGVNCCDAVDVADLTRAGARGSGKPGVAYPNSGEDWDAAARKWTGPAGSTRPSGLLADPGGAAGRRMLPGGARPIAGIVGGPPRYPTELRDPERAST